MKSTNGNGVLFVADRIMHYHAATMRAIEEGLGKLAIPFAIASAQDRLDAVGRVALREKVVQNHHTFKLTERHIGRFTIRNQSGLDSICAEVAPAVVVSMCHSGTISEWQMLRWARRRGVRRIAWQCGYEYNPSAIKASLLRRFVPMFDFHLCYHTNAMKYAQHYGATAAQTLVMHNTIDESRIVAGNKTEARQSLVAQWPQLAGKKIVLYVGAVLQEKRLEAVFDALRILDEEQVVFLIVGDGPHLSQIRKTYAGRTDWLAVGQVIDGVGRFFDAADVFVLPGTGGLAINEAMAHATAVISGYADGSADDLVIDGETGFRLESEQPQELAQRLREILGDPDRALAMGRRAEQLIRGDLSFKNFIGRVVGVLARMHAEAAPGAHK